MVAHFLVAAQLFSGLPEDKSANGEALEDGIDQLGRLLFFPDKLTLEHRQLDLAGINLNKKSFIFLVVVIWLE